MSKKKLFDDDSDEEVALKTENEYAKKYDAWREKEEIHKLEQKYGSKALDPDATFSSDSEDESDGPPLESEELETQFLKTLALLKTKDPRIYDPNFKCFDEQENKVKEKSIETNEKPKTLTFADSDDDDDDDPNIFTIEKKAEIDLVPEPKRNKQTEISKEGKLKDFLTGKVEHIEEDVEKDLEPLKAFWSDPKLNDGDAFLRDYILNKRYMEESGTDGVENKLRDDAELEADEELVEEQGKFERAYNFRFEEPDDEYLKRYPRTMNFIRPKDDKRARKRTEIRTRKEEEKKKKMEEIGRLKALKLKEIREKIAHIKEVTGNQELAFKDEDIEGDFDPEEHDRRMKAIFNETYYGEADHEKPVFPDLDEELEIENWEKYEEEEFEQHNAEDNEYAPHCDDEDFNMDADYDPKKARENLLEELKRSMGKKRRNRKRKTKLGQLLATEKPKFVPDVDRTYSEFMDEYYKMDCEDVIGGDLPTRFKYRDVVPNDYGLTVEEILLADDRELTQWVPLKKIVKHRPHNVEKSEVNTYKQKAADIELKKKMLPSLFKDVPQSPEVVVPVEGKKKRKKKKKDKEKSKLNEALQQTKQDISDGDGKVVDVETILKDKKKDMGNNDVDGERKEAEAIIVPKKKKKKQEISNSGIGEDCDEGNSEKLDPRHEAESVSEGNIENSELCANHNELGGKKKKKKNNSFIVETVGKTEPSQISGASSTDNGKVKTSKGPASNENNTIYNDGNNAVSLKKKKYKDKLDSTGKQNINPNKSYKKDFKMKFKAKDKGKQKGANKPTHPFSALADERLKAYGLHPKKYKNFLKYKKF